MVLNLAKEFKKHGHDVNVAVGPGQYLRQQLDGCRVPHMDLGSLERTSNPLKIISFIYEIKRLQDKFAFDVIHFHSSNALAGGMGAKLSRNRAVTAFTFHGLSVLDKNYGSRLKKSFYAQYFKFFLKFIDRDIVICRADRDQLTADRIIKGGEIIHNGLAAETLSYLERNEARTLLSQMLDLPEIGQKYLIGSIGRLAYQKNYEFLIDIFPEVLKMRPDAAAIIIGSGPEKEKYSELVTRLNLSKHIHILEGVDNASVYVKAFDLFVLPSRYEGLSISLMEAMFAGVNILASKVGGNEELVGPSHLYDLGNAAEFLEKIAALETQVPAAYAKDDFTAERMGSKHLEYYQNGKN